MSTSFRLGLVVSLGLCAALAAGVSGEAHADVVAISGDWTPVSWADGAIVTLKFDGAVVGMKDGKVKKGGNPNEPSFMWRLHKGSADGKYYLENLTPEPREHWLGIYNFVPITKGIVASSKPAVHAPQISYQRTGEVEIVKAKSGAMDLRAGGTSLSFSAGGELTAPFPSPVNPAWKVVAYQPSRSGDGTYKKATTKALSFRCQDGAPNASFSACYKCPSNYVPTYPDVSHCTGGQTTLAKGSKSTSRNSRAWWDVASGDYYKCASGYSHNPALPASSKGVCFKVADPFQDATKLSEKPQNGCEKGYQLDPLGLQCFKCPSDAPTRDWTKSIDHADACVSRSCGSENQRPCLITERMPSCDDGLSEDFFANKCVTNLVNTCTMVVNAILLKDNPAFDAWVKPYAEGAKGAKVDQSTQTLLSSAGKTFSQGPAAKFAKEAQRIGGLVKDGQKGFKDLFNASTFCGDPKKLLAKLKDPKFQFRPDLGKLALLERATEQRLAGSFRGNELGQAATASASSAPPHFYMSLGVAPSAAVVIGEQLGLAIVTDFKDDLATVFTLGPMLQSDVALAVVDSVMFYPAATSESFSGDISEFTSWGWEVGLGGGEGVVGGGSVAFPSNMGVSAASLYQPTPSAVGVNIGVGAGLLPVAMSVTASYSMVLTSTSL